MKKQANRALRIGIVSTIAASAIAATALAVPRLVKDDGTTKRPRLSTGSPATDVPVTESPATEAPPTETPKPAAIDTSDWRSRVAVQLGFTARIPQDWRGGWFEGHWDFHPKSLPGLPQGGDTFAVELHAATFPNGPWADQERELSAGEQVTINGQRFERRETTDAGPKIVFYAGNWTYPDDEYLLIQLFASTNALWKSYGAIGEAVARTVRVYDGSSPVFGTIPSDVKVDASTKAFVRFMDARVEGIGADELMTDNASGQYAAREGEFGLYGYNSPPVPWARWEFVRRDAADANSFEFGTIIHTGGSNDRRATEVLGIGPGRSVDGRNYQALVRFSSLAE